MQAYCTVDVRIQASMTAPAYVFYELTGFYQNHRGYVKSRSDTQIAGTVFVEQSKLDECDPLITRADRILHPCGLVANSFFNGAPNTRGVGSCY